jgi:hypothetical protein
MARQTLVTPACLLYWVKVLGEPVPNRVDPTKPRSWSVEAHFLPEDPNFLLLSQLSEQAFIEAHGPNAKQGETPFGWAPALDKDKNPTGYMRFRIGRNETSKQGRKFDPPTVIDAAKRRWPENLQIGNGSIGKVAYTIFPWKNAFGKCGVSLGLEGVQVLEHVPYGGSAMDAFDEEDAPTATTAVAAPMQSTPFDNGPVSEEELPF